ncbi:MAG: transposase [Rhodoplanes sp.]|uniref:REP-associated tyrosine transposase n=1 Tax=Rhodoplanes sp. TaxID=1968906 RepID=UPI0017E9A313|nr:transposase [Rhodoplanes sp.]NVO16174.1 transposase [Rhodoplanes sp.]
MPNYRRAFVPGGCWFFTVTLLDRRTSLLTDHMDRLRDAARLVRSRHPFEIDALVVLPDHLHAVWTLPDGDTDFPVRWSRIKAEFSRGLPHFEIRDPVRRRRGERGIWQRRYWEHLIRDERDYARHVEYCWINPVKHGLVDRVRDWPFSWFHRDVRAGLISEDWAGDVEATGEFGERES